ncbi:hypothetical protein KEM55_005256, partial [Ascosphaera atra]
KANVFKVQYDFQSPNGPREFIVPSAKAGPAAGPTSTQRRHPHPRQSFGIRARREDRRPRRPEPPIQPDEAIARRRYVYLHQLYSRRVGSNRLSQYRELSPGVFSRDEALVSRARRWVRRELQVFSFLYPESEPEQEEDPLNPSQRSGARRDRRANNAEFLLEYIIAILRTVDIKGASGSAEDLLQEFIGRDNARLFLHELQAFLRSPYTELRDWDRAVQYDERGVLERQAAERDKDKRELDTSIYPDSYVP